MFFHSTATVSEFFCERNNDLKVFDLIYVMTWGGAGRKTQVFATWMYFNTFIYHNAGYGSAIAWVMTIVIMLIAFPYIRVMSRQQ